MQRTAKIFMITGARPFDSKEFQFNATEVLFVGKATM